MKSRLAIFAILFTLFSCHPDDQGQGKKEELKDIIIQYYNALAAKDLQASGSLTTQNFVLFDEGYVLTNSSAIDSVKNMGSFKFSTTIDSLNVHVDKKDASAYYYRNGIFDFPDGRHFSIRFLESCTFNKEGDQWKLRFLHSTGRK